MVKKRRDSESVFYLRDLRMLIPLTMIGKERTFKEI